MMPATPSFTLGSELSMRDDAHSRAPAIYLASPLVIGTGAEADRQIARIAGLGFDTLLIAPPCRPGAGGNLFDIAEPTRTHPGLGGGQTTDYLADLSGRLAGLGMTLMVDVVLDHLAADAPLVAEHPDLFRLGHRGTEAPLDPRRPIARSDIAVARGADTAAQARLAGIFGPILADWARAGVAGFRAIAPQAVPAGVWRAVLDEARQVRPDLLAMAWTPGLSPTQVANLAGCGFTRSVGSAPWWDGRAPWLAREYEERRLVLPALGLVEDPDGPRLAAGIPGLDRAARQQVLERALALAAASGTGLVMPMGVEHGAMRPGDLAAAAPAEPSWRDGATDEGAAAAIASAIATMRRCAPLGVAGQMMPLSAPGAPVAIFARALGGDLRRAEEVALVFVNASLHAPATVLPDAALAALGGRFDALRPVAEGDDAAALTPGHAIALAPGEVRLFAGRAAAPRTATLPALSGKAARAMPRLAIERVAPSVDDGRFAVKRLAGEAVTFSADIFADGHDVLAAVLRWQAPGQDGWQEAPMARGENDRWSGAMPLATIGLHRVVVEAWRDLFATWRDEVEKKHAAGVPIALELREGAALVKQAAKRAKGPDGRRFAALLARLETASEGDRLHELLSEETRLLVRRWAERSQAVRTPQAYPVMADRRAAAFASWYEMFPRSAANDASRHGTFDDVVRHLPRVRAMGFDVLYFTPIHPIGQRNRKGRNNTLTPGPTDPGSPYAIGAAEGGHDALHPELGDLAAFHRLVAAAEAHGIEIALDFAIQCSPDHPWLEAHPGWFAWRPDGSLRYAENPPKKYEDIVNVDFYAADAVPDLWIALRDVILHWVEQGVRTFRVDNPHTKPLPFWEWMIGEVQARHPEAIFLSEAFTRPKMMHRLAKLGFTQSYTYFTWRNTKAELVEYVTELSTPPVAEFYRPHFFVNTPDINPVFLQRSGRAGHLIRAALAATLSGLWGVYSGFELCEAQALPGKEEYLDSEKYEIRAWDWDRPGNIVPEITALNRIRRENPALQTHLGVAFLNCWNDNILAFRKMTADRSNLVVVAICLDPFAAQEAAFEVPLWEFGLPDDGGVAVEDLVSGRGWTWHGKVQRLRLDPAAQPYAILRLSSLGGTA
jgi:starch synthase (maltosyl-transferring)